MINRLIEPTTGRIFIDGEDVTTVDAVKLRRGIGYVIQQIGLFPHQKILRNVMTVPLLYGESTATAQERARELMELVGLDPRPTATATRTSCPAVSVSGSAWPGRSPPIRRCC